eukprot:scaffold272407_cov37-Tisochrysis_lutea.AAC.3
MGHGVAQRPRSVEYTWDGLDMSHQKSIVLVFTAQQRLPFTTHAQSILFSETCFYTSSTLHLLRHPFTCLLVGCLREP